MVVISRSLNRKSGYHRGGTAEKRIYIPKLHRFLEPARAQVLLNASLYFSQDSELLEECMSTSVPLDSLAPSRITQHFMESRDGEMQFVADSDIGSIVAELRETVAALSDVGPVEQTYSQSLERWANVMAQWEA